MKIGKLIDLAKQGAPVNNPEIFSMEEINSVSTRLKLQMGVCLLLFIFALIIIAVDIWTLAIRVGELSIELTTFSKYTNIFIIVSGVAVLILILRILFPRLYGNILVSRGLLQGISTGDGIVSLTTKVDTVLTREHIDRTRTKQSSNIKTSKHYYMVVDGIEYEIENSRVYQELLGIKDRLSTLYFICGERSVISIAYLFKAVPYGQQVNKAAS